MSFVTPGLLAAGIAAIAIPILIHLLSRRRRKPVEWAAMRFLIEAFRRHRRRLRIEQLLLLAVRCLIVFLLGAALARPLLERSGLLPADGSRTVYLVVDDGLAASAGEPAALERHVETALAILGTLSPGDRVGVVTAARPAEPLLVPASTNHGGVRKLLQSLEPAESPTDLGAALRLVRGAIDALDVDDRRVVVYLLSEFRRGSAGLDAPLPEVLDGLGDGVQLLVTPPADAPVPNVQVTAIDPVRRLILPGAIDGSGQVTVRIARHGGELGREVSRVRLEGDGIIAARTVEWEPGQSEADLDFMLDVPVTGRRELALTASIDDDALGADNDRHIVIDLRRQIPAVLVDRRAFGYEPALEQLTAGQWIRRALDPAREGRIDLIDVEPAALGPADLRSVDAALLPRPDLVTADGWRLLREFVDDGGLLVVCPPAELRVHQWTGDLVTALDLPWRIDLEVREPEPPLPLAGEQPRTELLRLLSSELDRMARPVVAFRALAIETETAGGQLILTFADDSPMLVLGAPQPEEGAERARGLVALWAVSPHLGWTNLPSQVLMVPAFQELVRQGLSLVRAAGEVRVGDRPRLATSAAASSIVASDSRRTALDAAKRPITPLPRSGVYEVRDRADIPIGHVAVNIDPAAAVTETQAQAEIAAWLRGSGPWQPFDRADLGSALRRAETGSALAGLLLVGVLALVLIETLLARWFSHARAGGRTGAVRELRPSAIAPGGVA